MDASLLQAIGSLLAGAGGLIGVVVAALRSGRARRTPARIPRYHSVAGVRYDPGMEPIETVGARVRRVREAQGITIASLAETCHVSEGAIRQVETGGVKSPSLILGLRIAKALGVQPYWLGTGEETPLDVRVMELEFRVGELERARTTAPRR